MVTYECKFDCRCSAQHMYIITYHCYVNSEPEFKINIIFKM